eukprot:TRINITY_DN3187_c0_g3_i1.p1 TRINITY_DN3187_c0_g3~~TRINITY_DN3187_c0_g3_i1.p1  ORF type:complete len:191 (+),score=36.30 TRINITY_DN3187_c0_g3_i1:35-574(+)
MKRINGNRLDMLYEGSECGSAGNPCILYVQCLSRQMLPSSIESTEFTFYQLISPSMNKESFDCFSSHEQATATLTCPEGKVQYSMNGESESVIDSSTFEVLFTDKKDIISAICVKAGRQNSDTKVFSSIFQQYPLPFSFTSSPIYGGVEVQCNCDNASQAMISINQEEYSSFEGLQPTN